MIEIVFSQSAAGSLKQATSYGKGPYKPPAVSFAVVADDEQNMSDSYRLKLVQEHQKKERRRWEEALPLDIDKKDIYCLSMGLDMGDISEELPGEKRCKFFRKLFSIYPRETSDNLAEQEILRFSESIQQVIERIHSGEPARIWYSDNPGEICGMYDFMYHIYKLDTCGEIFTVYLPRREEENGNIVSYNGWGEIAPYQWHRFIRYTEKASRIFIKACALSWEMLKKENAPLRGVVNGRLISLPESYYDCFIEAEVEKQPQEFRQAVVIGTVLGRYTLGIGDAWLALRMEKMIEQGMLTPVTQPAEKAPVYHRILKKAEKSC